MYKVQCSFLNFFQNIIKVRLSSIKTLLYITDNRHKWDSQLLSETVIISTLFGLFWGHISTMGSSTRVRWRSNVLRKRNDSLTRSLAHTNNTNNIWNQIWSSSLTGETLTETMTNTQCCPCAWSNVSIPFIWEHKTCWHQEKGLRSNLQAYNILQSSQFSPYGYDCPYL